MYLLLIVEGPDKKPLLSSGALLLPQLNDLSQMSTNHFQLGNQLEEGNFGPFSSLLCIQTEMGFQLTTLAT